MLWFNDFVTRILPTQEGVCLLFYSELRLVPEIIQAPRTPRYSCLVLELHYFEKCFKPSSPQTIWEEYLLRSRATYFRDLEIAIEQLSEILLNRLHPTLRLEFPTPSPSLIGYQPLIQSVIAALLQKKTVTLHGAGGVGKSAIGATVVNRITAQPIFWYTFRLTLNDRLSNLLFTLGHFLHRQGATNLWQLVLTSGGEVSDLQVALGALLADLAELTDSPPILCFDELERLEIATPEQANPAHLQLLEFMGSLRSYTALLFIGQRPVVESDLVLHLHGLDQRQTSELCATRGITISEQSALRLHQQTNGNPRLLLLSLLLVQRGESVDSILATLAHNLSLYPVVYRLWQRLTEGERDLLRRLAVFRSPTPLVDWQADNTHLQNLLSWQLVRIDHKLANIFGDQQKLNEAENFARRALAYYEDSTNFLEMAKLQNNLANAYLTSYQFVRAIEVAQQAFRFAEAAKVPYYIATNAAVLATAHLGLHQFTQAHSYVERIFAMEEPQAIPNAFWVLGGIAHAEQRWQSAENYYHQSIEIAREQKNIFFEAYALADLAETYQAQGKSEEASQTFQDSITLFEKFGIAKEVQRLRVLLSQVSLIERH